MPGLIFCDAFPCSSPVCLFFLTQSRFSSRCLIGNLVQNHCDSCRTNALARCSAGSVFFVLSSLSKEYPYFSLSCVWSQDSRKLYKRFTSFVSLHVELEVCVDCPCVLSLNLCHCFWFGFIVTSLTQPQIVHRSLSSLFLSVLLSPPESLTSSFARCCNLE